MRSETSWSFVLLQASLDLDRRLRHPFGESFQEFRLGQGRLSKAADLLSNDESDGAGVLRDKTQKRLMSRSAENQCLTQQFDAPDFAGRQIIGSRHRMPEPAQPRIDVGQ